MNNIKYIGMDVHDSTISIAVRNEAGKLIMESVVETKRESILDVLEGLRGRLHVTFEEGTLAAWLYDLLRERVEKVLVCNPRKNLDKKANKNDRIDAKKMSELLRLGALHPVYHGEKSGVKLRELARSYLVLVQDCTRTMNRVKAIYRARAIACGGKKVYSKKHRAQWLGQLPEAGVHYRAEQLHQQLDLLQQLRRKARRALLEESGRHMASQKLRSIPGLGPLRAALLVALIQTPNRFRTKRQLWSYGGLGLTLHESGEYRIVQGQLERKHKTPWVRGLNTNHNHYLKAVLKDAATAASSTRGGVLHEYYLGLLAKGAKPEMARLTLARKIATIALTLWKKGEAFNSQELKLSASLSA